MTLPAPIAQHLDFGLANRHRRAMEESATRQGNRRNQEQVEAYEAALDAAEADLMSFVIKYGYQHGYRDENIDYIRFRSVIASQTEFHVLELKAKDIEGLEQVYVSNHRRGNEEARKDREYAMSHGAPRAPMPPDLGIDMRL